MRLRFSILTTFVLIGTPAISTAGPIDFNLEVTTTVTPGNPTPGAVDLTFNQHGNLSLPSGGNLEVGNIHYLFPEGPQDTSGTSYDATTTFSVKVKVTDTASGQNTTFQVDGAARDEWTKRFDGSWINDYHNLEIGQFWLNMPFTQSATLDGKDYVLQVTTYEGGTLADFELYIDPPHGITTPEPASALLGAIALLPIGLRVMRQRIGQQRNKA
ncbi:MAG: hypothetical protein K8U57_12900 [Planctomycetes bacterium]|nr:hypothetical protein [Planctomycetota bacterium]